MSEGTVVIGVGNRFRGDDAVGLMVVDMLRSMVPLDVRLLESDGNPTHLMSSWAEADTVVIVDGVQSGDAPGTVRTIDADAVSEVRMRSSGHLVGITEAIALARELNELPRHLGIVGVEVGETVVGADVTDDVRDAVPLAAAVVAQEIAAAKLEASHA